jgi:hypothetical protein
MGPNNLIKVYIAKPSPHFRPTVKIFVPCIGYFSVIVATCKRRSFFASSLTISPKSGVLHAELKQMIVELKDSARFDWEVATVKGKQMDILYLLGTPVK